MLVELAVNSQSKLPLPLQNFRKLVRLLVLGLHLGIVLVVKQFLIRQRARYVRLGHRRPRSAPRTQGRGGRQLSLIHISEPTRRS